MNEYNDGSGYWYRIAVDGDRFIAHVCGDDNSIILTLTDFATFRDACDAACEAIRNYRLCL